MATMAQAKNIMNMFQLFLVEQGYIVSIDNVDQETWKQLGEQVQDQMPKKTKKKSSPKVKDPNAPKRGKSSYIFFCAENRSVIQKELGSDAKAVDVTKELGVRWNALKQSTKVKDKKAVEKFEQEAKDDKERYDDEMKNYVRPNTAVLEEQAVKKKGKKLSNRKKDPNAPKRGKSAFIFFCAEKRSSVKEELGDDAKATDVTVRLGELWRELKEDEDRAEEFKVYNDLAAKDKVRFKNEMESYVAPPTDDNSEAKVPAAKGKKKSVDDSSDENKPSDDDDLLVEETKKPSKKSTKKSTTKKSTTKKSTTKKGSNKKSSKKKSSAKKLTGYTYFCRENRSDVKDDNPEMSAAEITKQLAKLWKELSEEEKQEWRENAQNQ